MLNTYCNCKYHNFFFLLLLYVECSWILTMRNTQYNLFFRIFTPWPYYSAFTLQFKFGLCRLNRCRVMSSFTGFPHIWGLVECHWMGMAFLLPRRKSPLTGTDVNMGKMICNNAVFNLTFIEILSPIKHFSFPF